MSRPVSTPWRVLSWLPVIAYSGLIWWLSSQALDIPTHRFPFRDKGVHFIEYGVLAFLMTHAVRRTWPRARFGLATAWWLTVALGLSDELHQAYVPGRNADIYDLLADALGAFAAVTLYGVLGALWGRRDGASVALEAPQERPSSERS